MRNISAKELKTILKLHKMWLDDEEGGEKAELYSVDLRGADLRGADLYAANLRGTDIHKASFRGADLRRADIDYSAWSLSCKSFDIKADIRLASQLAYHFCRLDCDDPLFLEAKEALSTLANKFHRVEECGYIETDENIR